MDPTTHPLKTLLQIHLASDISAANHLPNVLVFLNEECFLPSPHLVKWTTRINSLLHSKDPYGRWAGLCLACQTSRYSKEIMIEYAQGWLSVAIPLLSKNEPVPVLKAGIHLLYKIFSSTMDTPEFQRQVSIPNVPKTTTAMAALSEKHADTDFKAFVLTVLSRLVCLYPNLHRASHPALSSLALSYLNGNAPGPTSANIISAASRLYVGLHHTGGKVGAANLWRKSVEDTITFGWNSFFALRTTFPTEVEGIPTPAEAGSDDPSVIIPLSLDRLQCCVSVLRDLFRVPTSRAVQLPLGSLVKFCLALLTCSSESQKENHIDVNLRTTEVAIVPEIWKSGCQILTYLAACARHYLTPHLPRLVACLTIHLERKPKPNLRLRCLESLEALMMHCHLLDSDLIPDRLTKAILPLLTVILVEATNASKESDHIASTRKGKKRRRAFEGDEILQGYKKVICQTREDEESLVLALEVLKHLLRNPNLSPQMQSLSSRVLIAVYLDLSRLPMSFLSADSSLHARLSCKIQGVLTDIVTGTSNVASRSLGLIVACAANSKEMQRYLDLLVHPRVPPIIRKEPFVQSLALSCAEESQGEANIRINLGLVAPEDTLHRFPDSSKQDRQADLPDQDLSLQNQLLNTQNEPTVSSNSAITTQNSSVIAQHLATTTQSPASEPQIDQGAHMIESTGNVQRAQPRGQPAKIGSMLFNEPDIRPPPTHVQPTVVPGRGQMGGDEDEDEEMPAINMSSDTDGSDD